MLTEHIYFYDSFGILKSHISSFKFLGESVGNRTEAHAPEFSNSSGLEYTMDSGVFVKLDHSFMLDFYHEDQYQSKTDPYHLLNLAVGWKKNSFEMSLWVKNIMDETYVLRGMNFALVPSPNDPPYFFSRTYLSYGDPRNIGASASFSFK